MDVGLAYRSFIPVREQMVFIFGAVAVGHEAVYDAGLDVCPRRNGVELDAWAQKPLIALTVTVLHLSIIVMRLISVVKRQYYTKNLVTRVKMSGVRFFAARLSGPS